MVIWYFHMNQEVRKVKLGTSKVLVGLVFFVMVLRVTNYELQVGFSHYDQYDLKVFDITGQFFGDIL